MSVMTEIESRIDAVMREIGYEISAVQPKIANEAPAHAFCKEYDRNGFKYLVIVTERDVVQLGADKVVALKARMASKAGQRNL